MTLRHLSLAQFRSWPRLELELDDRPLAIFGPNGAGKTNILEALSMLSPGRGMRSAAPQDQARRGPEAGWPFSIQLRKRNATRGETAMIGRSTGAKAVYV